MQTEIIYWSLAAMTLMSSSIVIFFLIWNKKNISSKDKIQRLELSKQRDMLVASVAAQEEERKRLSENLHDDVGPLLSAINIQLGTLDIEQGKLKLIKETLHEAIHSVRTISLRMSPAVLTELGFNKALDQLCNRFREFSEIELIMDWNTTVSTFINKNEEINIYRIIQEVMNNTIKHSSASEFVLSSGISDKGDIHLLLKDNGVGFNTNINHSLGTLGLKNIKARTEVVNGQLKLESNSSGTKLLIILKHDRNG